MCIVIHPTPAPRVPLQGERDVLRGEICWYDLLSSFPLSSPLPVRTCLFLGPVSRVLRQSQKVMAEEATGRSLSWNAVPQLVAPQHCLPPNPLYVQRPPLLCQSGITLRSSCFLVPSGAAMCSAQPWRGSPDRPVGGDTPGARSVDADRLVGAGIEIFCPWHHLQPHGKGRNMLSFCLGETFNPKQMV